VVVLEIQTLLDLQVQQDKEIVEEKQHLMIMVLEEPTLEVAVVEQVALVEMVVMLEMELMLIKVVYLQEMVVQDYHLISQEKLNFMLVAVVLRLLVMVHKDKVDLELVVMQVLVKIVLVETLYQTLDLEVEEEEVELPTDKVVVDKVVMVP
tara:strand:+ start:253 stop:705 length:453 start_codon:yes stop_codon:yes gene_type:complete